MYIEMQRKDECICWKSFYARDISNRTWDCLYYKITGGFYLFFFFSFFYYSGILSNFNVTEQTLKMSGIIE